MTLAALAPAVEASVVLAAAALPGVALARARRERLALGAALSLGAHAALLSLAPALAGAPLLVADVMLAGLALPHAARRGRGRRMGASANLLEAAAVLLVALSFAALTARHGAPRGWDPSFHCLLVDRLAHGARPATWEPWEPVAVHYTLGADALVAHVARAARLEPHEAFAGSFPAAYALLAWSALGAFRRATGSRRAALAGALALGLLAAEIRLVYHWGGLPTVLGAALALAAAEARTWPAAGLVLGALPWCHHLTALIAWSATVVIGAVTRRRAVAKALALAALLALPLVPSVLGALRDQGSTSILRFADEPERPLRQYLLDGQVAADLLHVTHVRDWGWGSALLVLAVLGATRGRRARLALAVFAFLALVHVALDVGYREAARRLAGEDFTALTPSRWFQLASIPLAALAGLGASRVAPRSSLLVGAILVVGISLPFLRWEYSPEERGLDPEIFVLARWARERLPERALVVTRLPSRYWWPYLLGRETDETPLPASEPRKDPRVLAKRALAASPGAARAHARARGEPVFWLHPASEPPPPGSKRLAVFHESVALDGDAP